MINNSENLPEISESSKTSEIKKYTKEDLQVVLLNFSSSFTDDYVPYSQVILKTGVDEMNLPSLYSPIDKGAVKHSEYKKVLATNFKSDKSFQVVGISVDYETIPELIELSKTIKSGKPEGTFIVAGGQGTASEDVRKYLFDSGYIDAINIGHAQPFFDFLSNAKNTEILSRDSLFENAKLLLATVSEISVPEGVFPRLSSLPLMLKYIEDKKTKQKKTQLRIPHYQNCPNHCDYCAQQKTKNSKEIFDSIIKAIEEPKSKNVQIDYVRFEGPTFEGRIVETSKAILNAIKNNQGFMPSSQITMDSKQFQKENYDNTMSSLEEVNATSIHIGINSVDGNTASEVGRKNNGRVRTEEELQDEILGVLHFVENSKIDDFKIDMLLSPFDTESSIERIIDFNKKLLQIQKKTGKKIRLFLSPLIPYPGTPLFQRHREKINFTDYKQLKSSVLYDPTLWKEDESLFGTQFLRKFSAPFFTSTSNYLTKKEPFKEEYLQFLALSMTYQYFQGKTTLAEMDILYPEYRKDKGVIAIFNAIKTQSNDLMLHSRRRKYFKNHPAQI